MFLYALVVLKVREELGKYLNFTAWIISSVTCCIISPISAVSQKCSVDQIDLCGTFGHVHFGVIIPDMQKSCAQGLMNNSDLEQCEGVFFV